MASSKCRTGLALAVVVFSLAIANLSTSLATEYQHIQQIVGLTHHNGTICDKHHDQCCHHSCKMLVWPCCHHGRDCCCGGLENLTHCPNDSPKIPIPPPPLPNTTTTVGSQPSTAASAFRNTSYIAAPPTLISRTELSAAEYDIHAEELNASCCVWENWTACDAVSDETACPSVPCTQNVSCPNWPTPTGSSWCSAKEWTTSHAFGYCSGCCETIAIKYRAYRERLGIPFEIADWT